MYSKEKRASLKGEKTNPVYTNQCEGLVTMNDIPGDRFYFDQNKFAIVGTRNKKEFNFGDKVKVRIYEIHPQKRQIDLELVEE